MVAPLVETMGVRRKGLRAEAEAEAESSAENLDARAGVAELEGAHSRVALP